MVGVDVRERAQQHDRVAAFDLPAVDEAAKVSREISSLGDVGSGALRRRRVELVRKVGPLDCVLALAVLGQEQLEQAPAARSSRPQAERRTR